MLTRTAFLTAAAVAAAPLAARAQPAANADGHVHGANGIVLLPEHRPLEWKLDVLDGPPLRLSAYRRAVVVLTVLATYSDACRRQQPVLNAFALAHPDDTAVFGIAYHEDDRAVRDYRKAFAVPYPVAMERDEMLLALFENRHVPLPVAIVIRPGGTLSCAFTGEHDLAWFERERDYALASPA